MNNFKAGDKVKCIESRDGISIEFVTKFELVENCIYTVNKVFEYTLVLCEDPGKRVWNKMRFIKVDCLKNKVAKIRRLIAK